jgi:hypothetical protein
MPHRPSNRLRADHLHTDAASKTVMRIACPGHGLAHRVLRRRTTSAEQPTLEPDDGLTSRDPEVDACDRHAAIMA